MITDKAQKAVELYRLINQRYAIVRAAVVELEELKESFSMQEWLEFGKRIEDSARE